MQTTTSFLVFGVTGQASVAAAIAALHLRFVGQPETDTAPPAALLPNATMDEDGDEDDGDDLEDGTGWGWAEDEDLDDTPAPVVGVRTAKPSAFSQMVGGAVAGMGTRRSPAPRARTPEDAFAQLVGGGSTPQPTQQPGPHFFNAQPVVDTTAVLEQLAQGTPLAPTPAMLQTRLTAAAEGCALLTGQTPTGTPAHLTLHTTQDGTMALFIGLQSGAPWANLDLPAGADGAGQIEPYLHAVFPEWTGARLMQLG
jgi:hypothetical protein